MMSESAGKAVLVFIRGVSLLEWQPHNAAVHGVPANIVQSVVGHLDERTTQVYMDHATDEMTREKLANMPNLLGLPEPEPRGPSPEDQVIELLELMTEDNLSAWPSLRDRALQVMQAAKERAAASL